VRKAASYIGRILFWIGWPVFFVYFRLSERTRILIIHGDDILVVKNWISHGQWSLPGGGLRRGEKACPGIVREVWEELGVLLSSEGLQYLGHEQYKKHGLSFDFHLFLMYVPQKFSFDKQLIELADVQWKSITRLTRETSGHDILLAFQKYATYLMRDSLVK
jgi:8-oxo-dGTP pyrophosphatase MutT (NUDIX family)